MGSKKRSQHDVFVNFRGPDVREGFLKNLHEALVQSGIKTFVDSKDLHTGQKLTPALERAIERSLVAIVVFSQDYASSEWCLNELVKILECSKLQERVVKTVFYKVEPSQVSGQTGNYGKAMAKHEGRHGRDSHLVKEWEKALVTAFNLPGSHLQDQSEEAEFIRGVVEDVKAKLQCCKAKRSREAGHAPLSTAASAVASNFRVLPRLPPSAANVNLMSAVASAAKVLASPNVVTTAIRL